MDAAIGDNGLWIDRTLADYAAAAAADTPTPGGGSVAAAAAALGAAMASMSARFTLGRKKYAAARAEAAALAVSADEARAQCLEVVDQDTEAFAGVGAAHALPKTTDAEKAARRAAIAAASLAALRPPLSLLETAAELLARLPRLAEIGNVNLVSDTLVAAELLYAAARAAAYNVAMNLDGLDDAARAGELRDACRRRLVEAAAALAETRRQAAPRVTSLAGLLNPEDVWSEPK